MTSEASSTQAVARARAAVIGLYRAMREEKALGARAFARAWNAGRIAAAGDIRRVLGPLSANTLRRWEHAFLTHGLDGLEPRFGNRRDDGAIGRDADLGDYIAAQIAARPHISAAMIMAGLEARFADDGRRLPSFRSVQRFAARFKKKTAPALLAISDPDAWRSKYQAAAGSRSAGIDRPNQLWELDSTLGDVMLLDPDTGQPRRFALIKAIDVATRRTMMLVARSSAAAGIAALMRKAILAWGVPERIKTDNGRDYTSWAIENVLADLGIDRDLCPPFTPEAKPHVERAFKTFLHSHVELLPGFIGHNVAGRKAIENRRSFSRRLGESDRLIEVSLSPGEFQRICDEWAEGVYAHNPHRGLGGRTPFTAAAAYMGAVRRIADERALDVLLLAAMGGEAVRTVGKKGIQLDGGCYSAGALGAHVGHTVRVLKDPGDLGRILVFGQDGGFICEALNLKREGVKAEEIAAAKRAIQKAHVAESKAALRAKIREVGVDGVAGEIRAHGLKKMHNVVAMTRSAPHETPALLEAGRAARASDFTAREDSAEDKAAKLLIAERLSRSAREPETAAETPRTKYARALAVEAALQAGRAVGASDEQWFRLYSQSIEFRVEAAKNRRAWPPEPSRGKPRARRRPPAIEAAD